MIPNEVYLWPPDAEEEIWTVHIIKSGKKTSDEFTDYEKALQHAKDKAAEMGVVAWGPTRDGETRDL